MFAPSQGISLGGEDTSGEDEDEEPESELRDFVVSDGVDVPDGSLSSSLPLNLMGGKAKGKRLARGLRVERLEEEDDEDGGGGGGSGSESDDAFETMTTKGATIQTRMTDPEFQVAAGAAVRKRKRNVVDDSDD